MLRILTDQRIGAWEELRTRGVLRARARFIDPFYLPSYRWIAAQLRRRVGPAPRGVRYPVWGWVSWLGRQGGPHWGGTDPRDVRIHFDVHESQVLISDYHSWHCVLNDIPLHLSDEEENERAANAVGLTHDDLLLEEHRDEMVRTWDRAFDLALGHSHHLGGAQFQAVFWEIRLDQVRRVTRYSPDGRHRVLVWKP